MPVEQDTRMPTLRYWAAAKEAAGVPSQELTAGSLAAALELARGGRGERFATVLGRCSYVVDGDPVGGREHAAVLLRPDSVVDVLPPFAGG